MKIGIMGLGNIFTKAYLPIISTMQDIDFVLHSSKQEKLEALSKSHGFKTTETDFDRFINCGLDAVFIHTPTETHYHLIKQFLEKDIHVFVDKPLSDKLAQTRELLDLANSKNLILMVGFNRRFAPQTQILKETPDKNMIIVRKNRESAVQKSHFALYDMMIHVVDTALYLLDDEITDISYSKSETNGEINRALLSIETQSCTLLAYMNMHSGARLETYEVMSPSKHQILENLDTLHTHTPKGTLTQSFSDWTPTLEKRGFSQMIHHFIRCIESNDNSGNNDALQSHEIIDAFL